MIRPIAKFFSATGKQKRLIIEILLCLIITKTLLRFIPFKKISAGLGNPNQESPSELSPHHHREADQIKQMINKVGRHVPAKNKCLVEAIAAKWMFNRRRIPSTLYLGAKPNKQLAKSFYVHAWLRCGDVIVTGEKKISEFKTLSTFGDSFP